MQSDKMASASVLLFYTVSGKSVPYNLLGIDAEISGLSRSERVKRAGDIEA